MEPKIQIKYVNTRNQLADILTKGSFSRDEWNHLLRLFNIMSFSVFPAATTMWDIFWRVSHKSGAARFFLKHLATVMSATSVFVSFFRAPSSHPPTSPRKREPPSTTSPVWRQKNEFHWTLTTACVLAVALPVFVLSIEHLNITALELAMLGRPVSLST